MKRYFKYILGISMLFAASSCTSVLDVLPEGSTSLDEIFSEEVTAGAYLNTCYAGVVTYSMDCDHFNTNSRIGITDDAHEYNQNVWHTCMTAYNGSITATNNYLNYYNGKGNKWEKFWAGIRSCNLFLENINKTPMEDEAVRARWIAEATLLRAYLHFEAIVRWGGLPIVREYHDVNYDPASYKRETFKASVDAIIKDCDIALSEPNLPWRITVGSEAKRMTKAIAWAIKSRAMLYVASPLWNGGENYWAEAESVTKEALDECLANGYALYTQHDSPDIFISAYDEYFLKAAPDYSADPIDKETIFLSTTKSTLSTHGFKTLLGANKAGLCPTQELVDAYCMAESGLPVLDLENPYNDKYHLEPNINAESGYDEEKPFEGRDPRFYATVYYNGSKRINKKSVLTTLDMSVSTVYGVKDGNERAVCITGFNGAKATHTGYYSRKYDHPQSTNTSQIAAKYVFYRLAELYLNYAEAANEAGNTAAALAQVNIIRDRVGMPHVPATLTQDEARLWIANERRVELAYEENRYYDLRRWNTPDGDLVDEYEWVTGMLPIKVAADNALGYEVDYQRFVVNDIWTVSAPDPATTGEAGSCTWSGIRSPRLCVSNQWLYWPIPTAEVNRLEAATGDVWQNPGW